MTAGCGDPAPAPDADPSRAPEASSEIDAAVEQLVDYAAERRASLDFARLPPWSERSGSDPFALVRDGERTLGLLRRGWLAVLDGEGRTIVDAHTTPGATAVERVGDALVVAAEGRGDLHVLDANTLAERGRHPVPGVASIRDLAYGAAEGRLYLADPHRHRLLAMAWPPQGTSPPDVETLGGCEGALSVIRSGDWLVANCLLGHRLELRRIDADGRAGPPTTIEHDGPMWSIDVATTDAGGLHVLVGGVEDRPLDRTDGAFGYIDSFAFVYSVEPTDQGIDVRRRHMLDVGEHGVITPKHVRWTSAPDAAAITSYGSDVALEVDWSDSDEAPRVRPVASMPGITAGVGSLEAGLFASPLLDAWVVTTPDAPPRVVPVADPSDERSPSERLGEALAFTGLMAPKATSEGRRSRFTCETCHFEGRTDGRTHWTGREQVHATTKTLRGLLNNRPHFSRALDRTTAGMVHSEFRVANTGTEQDPWFSLTRADAPWLDALGAPPDPIDPVTLRRALIDFLAAFTPEPNPSIRGMHALDPTRTAGMQLFARHCESCHSARLVSDDPASAVPPERWAEHVLHPSGGIVWGSERRSKTGVEPLVHPSGPRAPSLRRLWVKRPLLTNGNAKSVRDVLDAIRLDVDEIHGGGEGTALAPSEHDALMGFLELL